MAEHHSTRSAMSLIWRVLLGLLIAILLFAAFLPSLISTSWGKEWLLSLSNRRLNGTLTIERLQLGWFSKQTVQGLKLYDKDGHIVLSLDRLSSDKSPLHFLSSLPDVGNIEVVGLKINLIEQESGLTSLQTVLGQKPAQISPKGESRTLSEPYIVQLPFIGNVTLKDASITWSGSRIQALAVTNINAQVNIPGIDQPATAHLEGISQQGDLKGEFAADATLSGFDVHHRIVLQLDGDGVLLPQAPGNIDLSVQVKNLGVDVLDRLATLSQPHLRGAITAALGDRLNFELHQILTSDNATITLQAASPNLSAELVTEVRDGKVALQKPGLIALTLTPKLADFFVPRDDNGLPVVKLANETSLKITLDRLTIPSSQSTAESEQQSSLRLHMEFGGAQLVADSLDSPIMIDKCEGSIERQEAADAFLVHVDAQMSYAGESGHLQVHGKWVDVEDLNFASPWKLKGDFALTAEKLPSAPLDALLGAKGLFRDMVGGNIDIAATLHGDGTMAKADVKMGSDKITIPSLLLNIDSKVTLAESAQLHTQLTPALFKRLIGTENTLVLTEEAPILATLKNLNWPLKASDKSVASVDLEIGSGPLIFDGVVSQDHGKLRVSNLRLNVKASSLSQAGYALAANIAPDNTASLMALFGSVSSLQVSGQISSDKRNGAITHTVNGSFHNELAELTFKGRITPEHELVLISPAQLHYKLQPATVAALTASQQGAPRLLEPADIAIIVKSLKVPFKGEGPSKASINGSLTSSRFAFGDQQGAPLAGLNDILVDWNYDGLKQEMALKVNGKTQIGSIADGGKLDVNATIAHWAPKGTVDLNAVRVQARGNLSQLPITVLSALSGHPALSLLVGDTLDVRFDADLAPNGSTQQGNIDLSFIGKGFEGGAAFTISDKLRLKEGTDALSLQFNLTPERFEKLQGLLFPPHHQRTLVWRLADSTKLQLRATDISLPWKTSEASFTTLLGKLAAKIDISMGGLELTDTILQQTTVYDSVAVQIATTALGDKLTFGFTAKEAVGTAEETVSQFQVQGTIDQTLSNGKWFDPALMGLTIDVNARQVPLALFIENPAVGQQISTYLPLVFGRKVDGTLRAALKSLQGPVSASIKGSNGNFALQGQIRDDRLTLAQPMTLTFKLTPEIATTMMGEIMPILSTALGSDQPVSLTIDSNNFSLPLKEFSPAALQIGKATVGLGRVSFRQEGQMGSIVSLLNFLKSGTADRFSVWFTPIYFSIIQGQVKVERLDAFIAERYPIAVWGRVDLVKERVNMTIGLSAQALREAYGIRNLGDDYMLQLALRGPLDKASIDKARAATRITSLIAQSQGDTSGLILSGVMDLIGGSTGDSKVPSQTTNPLPWGNPEKTTVEKQQEKPNPTVDKVQKQIEKGAEKLLDWLR